MSELNHFPCLVLENKLSCSFSQDLKVNDSSLFSYKEYFYPYNCQRFFFFSLHLCVCMPHLCRCLQRPEEGTRSPGAGVVGSWEPPYGFWEPNSDLLEEQQAFFTVAPCPLVLLGELLKFILFVLFSLGIFI